MKISRLRITIAPVDNYGDQIQVHVVTDGQAFTAIAPLIDSDFESNFDYCMEYARREILRLVKQAEAKKGCDDTAL